VVIVILRRLRGALRSRLARAAGSTTDFTPGDAAE
jgi:hypothetical protein